ncbi:FAD-dependent monooxygenase [Actinoplanes sp. NPDC049596]|uniref:FAD-dependent monooxygenase n=1 Tax=unclassified Actinoplanes TaxID=2626549 RepID=UPI00343F29B1
MTERTVLISGAGIAGATLAYWMARHGWRPTVVELAASPRSSGNPVDVRNEAVAVASKMGVMPALKAVATHATGMRVIDSAGRSVARLPVGDGTEIPRGDLAVTLLDAARDDAEFLMNDTITALDQDAYGVEVTFARAEPARFDLVVGADGLHSTVRRLAFGPEGDFVHHLGLYVATVTLGGPSWSPDEVLLHNTPGRLLAVHPGRGTGLAAFIFRHPEVPGLDHRDTARQRHIVTAAYESAGWRIPELLHRLSETDFYFDAVSRVTVPTWSRGRIALTGDAASCVSLFGDGSSLAMAGAYALATSLADSADLASGLRRYEAHHRKLTDPKQRHAARAAGLLVPRTRPGLTARNAAARMWSSTRAAA